MSNEVKEVLKEEVKKESADRNALRVILKYMMGAFEMGELQQVKKNAANAQDFVKAAECRAREMELERDAPTLDRLKKVYESLN